MTCGTHGTQGGASGDTHPWNEHVASGWLCPEPGWDVRGVDLDGIPDATCGVMVLGAVGAGDTGLPPGGPSASS